MNRLIRSKGFTLLEVVVALFVLTIGMLGSTSMMLRSQQRAEESNMETSAAQRAWNIAELLRSNIKNVNDSSTNFDAITVNTAGTAPTCISTGCNTAAEVIELNTFLIGLELDTFMPNTNPSATITDISGIDADPVMQVDIQWEDLDKDGNTITKSYRMIFQP